MIFLLTYLIIEEKFKENFGSSCIDFIPHKNIPNFPIKKDCIFISIASYRDDECSTTLSSIYDNADKPENVFCGICEQNKENLESCTKQLNQKFINNISVHNMNYKDAKGPTFARYHCSTKWKGEEYYLQIDSHTQFVKNWDDILINMMRQAEKKSNYPVLSCYPPTKEQLKVSGTPIMCNGKLQNNKIPSFLAGWESKEFNEPQFSPKPFAAGGFMCLRGEFLFKIPYDPNLPHVFQGEEVLFSARLWTNGYDFFTPNKKILHHHYGRKGKPKFWNDHKNSGFCRSKAENRVLFLLEIDTQANKKSDKSFFRDLHVYGLGKDRTMKDFWKAAGIDFSKKGVEAVEDWCNNNKSSDKFKGWNFKINGYSDKIRKI